MKRFMIFAALSVLSFSSAQAIAAKIDIVVSKSTQKMTVRVDGEIEYVWPVSTGGTGYDTPSGNFRAFRLEEDHKSTEWDDAPMPHSIFFTPRGHAIHGSFSKRIGQRASHGCVRLAPENAEQLFSMVEENGLGNTTVTVKGGFFDFGAPEPRSTQASLRGSRFFGTRENPVKSFNRQVRKVRADKPFEFLFGKPKTSKPIVRKVVKKTTVKKTTVKVIAKKPLKVAQN